MNKKTVYLLIGVFLLILLFVSAIKITTFYEGLISENITFGGNENFTRNISIYKNANVTSAYMNLSGFKNNLIDQQLNQYGSYQGSSDDKSRIFVPQKTTLSKVEVYIWTDGLKNMTMHIRNSSGNNVTEYLTLLNLDVNGWVTFDFQDINIISGDSYTIYMHEESSALWYWVRNDTDAQYNYKEYWWSYPTNPFISINNTQIWNHSGEFNETFSPNKTSDFSSTINTALNSGACDCTGCFLSGNNCTINFTFHSDTAGILEYSAIDINWSDITAPSITIDEPQAINYADNNTMVLNYSVFDYNAVSMCWYNVYLLTPYLVAITNTTLTNCSNSTFSLPGGDENYRLKLFSNDTFGNEGVKSVDFGIRTNAPSVILNSPTNNQWFNNESNENIHFNYTATDSDGLDTCKLWGNWTGTWAKNYTWTSLTSGTMNYTNVNITNDGYYMYNVWCNDTLGNSDWGASNFSFSVDITFPIMNDMTITTTADQTQFTFLSNITDAHMGTCKYSIWTGSIAGTNISFTCNTNTLANAPGFGTYTLYVYATDLAGNENAQKLSFTTSIYVASTTTGGGGGGGIIEMIKEPAKAFICESIKEPFSVALKEWLANMWNWTKFKAMWFAMWNYSNCLESASLVPL